jgi:hypothetical protein
MGLYDHVRFTAPCWKCGEPITLWQSKDAQRLMQYLRPEQVQHFYEACECGAWNEYRVVATTWDVIPNDERTKING